MNEMEFDLTQILKDCKGIKFFSTLFGDTEIVGIYPNDCIDICPYGCPAEVANIFANGKFIRDGIVVLFPSRALYEKYPLDAYSAWDEWASERKPKRWRAEKYEKYFFITEFTEVSTHEDCEGTVSDRRYKIGNYFRTKEEAQQAAEAVKNTLMKFHETHSKK